MNIQEHVSLKPFTTLRVGGPARFFCQVQNPKEMSEAVSFAEEKKLPMFILGGGSNIVISDKGFDGLVIQVQNKGIEKVEENEFDVLLKVASGEVWDEVVSYVVDHGWWGIENLSHIPGLAGGLAVQNVGAYGQEASQVVEQVEAYDLVHKKVVTLTKEDCQFSYRQSIFNSNQKGTYVIFSTVLRLRKEGQPNASYPDFPIYFQKKNILNPTLQDMRAAVIEIRDSKLPWPADLGSVGSFFKNVFVTEAEYVKIKETMEKTFDEAVMAKLEEIKKKFQNKDGIKISAAFLVDACGLKGKQIGGAAVYDKHALVIVNKTGEATTKDVLTLAKLIQDTVFEKTGIKLQMEPEKVGF